MRNYKGNNRPADMIPDAWNPLDKKHKQIVKYNFLKYRKPFPTDVDIANAASCRPLIENQEIDVMSKCPQIQSMRYRTMNLSMLMDFPMGVHTSLHHIVCRRLSSTLATQGNILSLKEVPLTMMLMRISRLPRRLRIHLSLHATDLTSHTRGIFLRC